MRINPLLEVIGWSGAVAVVVAYVLTTWRVLSPDSWLALTLNLTGAAGIAVVSWRKRAYQPAVLNLIWLTVAGVSLWRVIFG